MASEAVVNLVLDKLGKLLRPEAQRQHGVDLKWMQEELMKMRSFLKYADSRQKDDAEARKWVAQIREIFFDVDEFVGTIIDGQTENRATGFTGGVKRLFSHLNTSQKIKEEFGRLKQKIDDISRESEAYGIRMDINEGRHEASSSHQSFQELGRISARSVEREVVGQQEEISTLKKQLINGEQRRCVISIFGMGGSGKTTLAREVYHNVKNDFECDAFICLSQKYEMKDVLIRVITCVMSKSRAEIENLPEDELGTMLRDHLKGKKYLVVIDDIWSKEAWNMLEHVLPNGKDQSRVILTTRIKDVAVHANPVSPLHEMRLLNDNEGWELFMKKVFPEENPSAACPSELEETGRKIFKKCGGLPLAILVIGDLLAKKGKRERAWSRVLKSIPQSSEKCLHILALSYWDLPHYLKKCFLYFRLFPEDYEISSGKLIRMWIAEGFIEQKGDKLMEDVAEDYLEDLVSRSMIQVASKRSNGSIRKCRIHCLLRHLAITEARENNFFTVHNDNDTRSSSTSVRRRAFYGNIDGDWTKNNSIEILRSTLYFFHSNADGFKLLNTSSKFLRVTNVEFEGFSHASILKEDVGEFVDLKFLEFSSKFSHNTSIPPSIGKLSSLQTLKVRGSLPNTIWKLKELRHLHADDVEGHLDLSNLRNLQTLSLKAGSWINEGIGKLTNLRKLKISGDMSPYHDTLPYCIEKLCNLRLLKLRGKLIPPFQPFTLPLDLYKIYLEGRIEKLPELPPNLVELILYRSELQQDAIFTLEKLQHLKILRLMIRSYISKQMICSPGGFPRLELLELDRLPLEKWIVEEGAMISLKSVELTDMDELKTENLPERVRTLLKEVELGWRTTRREKRNRA